MAGAGVEPLACGDETAEGAPEPQRLLFSGRSSWRRSRRRAAEAPGGGSRRSLFEWGLDQGREGALAA